MGETPDLRFQHPSFVIFDETLFFEYKDNMKDMFVYIIASKHNTSVYSGVTNNLVRRIYEHRNELIDGFSKRYHIHKLVYYEVYDNPIIAIQREKNIKHYPRSWKDNLVNGFNPQWRDLYDDICK